MVMNKEFYEYFDSIGISKILRERIETIYEFYKELLPSSDIKDIFLSDYINESGERIFENLWFFSEEYAMEAKLFATQDNFDMDTIKNNVHYWTIEKTEYDFKTASSKSRMFLTFNIGDFRSGKLKASQENCNNLKKIFLKYTFPNFAK